jgi:hypothetical protein
MNVNVITVYVMFLFEKNDMLSTLVILKLMHECASLSNGDFVAMNFVTTICIR